MASNYTSNYSLSQWEGSDQFSRVDFNSDFAKIDAALKGLADGKAGVSSVSALSSRVASLEAGITKKADKTTVSTLEDSMVRIVSGQYVGSGARGSGNPKVLDFSATLGRPPQLVIVRQRDAQGEVLLLLHGVTSSMWNLSGDYSTGGMNTVSWTGNKVSWHAEFASSMFNEEGKVYMYFAIG